jgi:hypothetical protein
MKKSFNLSLITAGSLLAVIITGCLKDDYVEDGLAQPRISESPKVVELPGTFRGTTSYNSSYAVSLNEGNKDTTFNVVPVRLASDQPAEEDVQVQLEIVPELISAYNDSTHSELEIPASTNYTFSNNMVVTIPKGAREGYLQMTTNPANLISGQYGFGIRIKSVSNPSYIVSGNFNNAVVIVGVKNKYDGLYTNNGYALRVVGGEVDPSLSGNYSGSEVGLITTGPNSVIYDELAYWGDGASGIGIGNPELAIDPNTNKITITSSGGAMNAPNYDSRYDPETKTFYISFTWGAGPAARLKIDTLVYQSPRP